MYLWLHWVFIAALRLPLVVASRDFVAVRVLLVVAASLVAEQGL